MALERGDSRGRRKERGRIGGRRESGRAQERQRARERRKDGSGAGSSQRNAEGGSRGPGDRGDSGAGLAVRSKGSQANAQRQTDRLEGSQAAHPVMLRRITRRPKGQQSQARPGIRPTRMPPKSLGAKRPAAATGGRRPQARSTYSPVLVLTRTLSPALIKSGTWISAPVSILAGFLTPWAVLPLIPGSVSVIS